MGKILEARYLNVDFLVEAEFDLSPLVEALKKDVTILWDETSDQSSSFGIESNLTGTETAEEDILELLRIMENLPNKLSQMLLKSRKKVFDIGFECGTLDTPFDAYLSAETVQRIAQLSCSVNFKLYPWVEHPYAENGDSPRFHKP